MPTVVTVTVKPSGGDYTSLSAAEAAEQADLVSADVQLDIECYAMSDTTRVTFDGWTTDSTRYPRIIAPTAERHSGVWSTSKYRLDVSAAFQQILSLLEAHTRVFGLQVRQAAGNGCTINAGATGILIDTVIARSAANSDCVTVAASGGTVTFRNFVAYGGGTSFGFSVGFGSTAVIENATVANFDTGLGGAGVTTARNVYSGGNATVDFTGIDTMTTCASEDATGTSGLTGIAYDTTNFVSVTGGSEDLHLVTGSALIGAGTDLSGTFTLDVDGDTRASWDIGADEIVAAPGGGALLALLQNYGLYASAGASV